VAYKLLIVGSMPPPYSGYETATEVLMRSMVLSQFETQLFDTRTTRNPAHRGKWSVSNLFSTWGVILKLMVTLIQFRPNIANVPLAQNMSGFLKWFALASICKLSGARVVSRLGGEAFDEFYSASPWWMQWVIKVGLSIPSIVIVRGASLAKQFEGLIDVEKIAIVPNGFDVRQWSHGFSKEEPHAKLRVFYVGQVTKAKGVLDLLEATGLIKKAGFNAKFEFVIAGPIIDRERNILHVDNPKSMIEEIKMLQSEYQLDEEYVRFVGAVSWDEKRKFYAWADVVVTPSYSEGFPYTILEFFSSDCAVISTPVGALPDYLIGGKELEFVPVNSPSAIANALQRVSDDRVREKLIKTGADYLARTHDIPVFSRHMISLFDRVMDINS